MKISAQSGRRSRASPRAPSRGPGDRGSPARAARRSADVEQQLRPETPRARRASSFAAACDSSHARAGRTAPAFRASAASAAPKNRARSFERFACLRARSIFAAGAAFSKLAPDALLRRVRRSSVQATIADFALPETRSCGFLRAAVQKRRPALLGHEAREVLLDLRARSSTGRSSRAARRTRLGRVLLGERRERASGSSTFLRRKCSRGSGVRFFSAETSESGTFAPATSSRITSSAGFISTSRPAPRPGHEVDLARLETGASARSSRRPRRGPRRPRAGTGRGPRAARVRREAGAQGGRQRPCGSPRPSATSARSRGARGWRLVALALIRQEAQPGERGRPAALLLDRRRDAKKTATSGLSSIFLVQRASRASNFFWSMSSWTSGGSTGSGADMDR